ncbi:MAG TPA: MerR family transcriptional regulator [Pseudonocardiaceae bacterium]|nr:MerR family transcriptional regulator [Pseudonocardiaceae bacterium]
MFSIGDFARHGRVSIRMLRHYDAIGLLRPAQVDPVSGYRSYEANQLSQLNRIVALKDLGFTLHQVQDMLNDRVDIDELRGMLKLRRAQLQAQIVTDTARLTQVEARLRTIEREGQMSVDEVIIKQVPAVRVAELTAVAASYAPEHIGPASQPLYQELMARLAHAGVTIVGAPISYYEDAADGAVLVHASAPVAADADAKYDFQIVDLPGIDTAAAILHHGSMDNVVPTGQELSMWVDTNGYRSTGYAREVYLDCPPDMANWVTELQAPVELI